MKKRTKWVLLALIAIVAIILVVALLRGCQQDPGKNTDPDVLPLDDSPLASAEQSEDAEEAVEAAQPNIDPESGIELEEDELPIITD